MTDVVSDGADTAAGLPVLVARDVPGPVTGLVLIPRPGRLPDVGWAGPLADGTSSCADADRLATELGGALAAPTALPRSLLPEHVDGWFGRPGLVGHRLDPAGTGRDWTPRFADARRTVTAAGVLVEASDPTSGLALVTEVEAVAGGALRARHALTNVGDSPYSVTSLEVVFPLPGRASEVLDFTGRHEAERVDQRHTVTDGLWLRESRRGRPSFDSATVLCVGTPGFGFGHGEVYGLHVGWSGNHVHRVERLPDGTSTIGGGELLLPGEMTLAPGATYTTPWVYLAASSAGLDDVAAAFHGYLRALPNHPSTPRPVTLNVWEAVYFQHDISRLRGLADLAASVGVERFVLDDGWFRHRRDDRAGLGDWYVDEGVWPEGLAPLADHVRGLGMQFGLWFEPEMVNPDSDLFREHPDWILSARGRVPREERFQQVLDLSRPEVVEHLIDRIDAVLTECPVDYVKWDHNRELLEAGSRARSGAPAVHDQTLGYYRLLDELRRRHPGVEWESCASGGGRIDLAVLERTERVWVSDMTDALSRQRIQRWTAQLVAPEYLGAHVSSTAAHQTGRVLPLPFRAATAFFGHFGIEWDLTAADAEERAHLSEWVALHKRYRALLHSGRVVRVDHPDPALWVHGVVAADRSSAVLALVQMGESFHSRPEPLRVRGLDPAARYRVRRIDPAPSYEVRHGYGERPTALHLPEVPLSGAVVADVGFTVTGPDPRKPAQRPETAVLLELRAV